MNNILYKLLIIGHYISLSCCTYAQAPICPFTDRSKTFEINNSVNYFDSGGWSEQMDCIATAIAPRVYNYQPLYTVHLNGIKAGDIADIHFTAQVTTEIPEYIMFAWYIQFVKDNKEFTSGPKRGTNINHDIEHHYPFSDRFIYKFQEAGDFTINAIIYTGAASHSEVFQVNRGAGNLQGIIFR